MVEVQVTRIVADDDSIELMDGRLANEVWLVPVIFELADGYTVPTHRKVHGSIDNARAYRDALPMVPTYPMTCVFDENDELVKVITKNVVLV
jgi:hypothetical protein